MAKIHSAPVKDNPERRLRFMSFDTRGYSYTVMDILNDVDSSDNGASHLNRNISKLHCKIY